jgi:dUTP pyrophosphatase
MSGCIIKLIKTHPDAVMPNKAHDGDNCFDVYAVEKVVIPGTTGAFSGTRAQVGHATVPVGLKVGYITPGFGFVFRGRSGMGFKHGIQPHFGEIDNGYRGDISVKLYNFSADEYVVKPGDRIAQIKVEKVWDTIFEETEELVESSRGEGGFGSSGI